MGIRCGLAVMMALSATACIEDARVAGPTDNTPDAVTDTGSPQCAQGQRRCSQDATTLSVCQNGTWQRVACGQGFVCLDTGTAQCIQAAGDDTCRDVFECILECGIAAGGDAPGLDECYTTCVLDGSPEAQDDAVRLFNCLEDAECGNDLGCIEVACDADIARCYYAGSGDLSCREVLLCSDGCATDACEADCAERGDFAAQKDLGMLELCLLLSCGLAAEQSCINAAVATECRPWFADCQAPFLD